MALDAHDQTTLSLPITGMTCAGCAGRVERALAATPGVAQASVNLATERAQVSPAVALPDIVAQVRAAGFGVRLAETRLRITGMTCAGCAGRIERALAGVAGVAEASVNLATETATVRHLADAATPQTLAQAVAAAGYGAQPDADDADRGAAEAAAQEKARLHARDELLLAALLTAPLVAQMVAMAMGATWHLMPWMEATLATPVVLWAGRRFFAGAARAVRAGAANMDVLVALGAGSAWAVSLWMTATMGEAATGRLYFEAAAVIVTLVLVGKVLEAGAKRAAAAALTALMALQPARATVLRGGAEVEVAVGDVALGEIVVVRPGERVAVDGVIVRGETELDESLITGESMPVARGVGDAAPAGAMNGGGMIRLRAERVGRDTTLARIARLVADAQTGKAPVQRLVDRVSAAFVPLVLALAALTFAGWLLADGGLETAFSAAVSVLVIACPCALGLATPTALVAGTGAAARAGILIRDIATLERAHHVTHVVFDKTGTLTMGAPELVEMLAQGMAEADALALAAGAQTGSEHPLGRATVAAAKARGLTLVEPQDFAATVGAGVAARVAGRAVRVGKRAFVGGDAPPALAEAAARLEDAGRTVVWLGVDGARVAVLAFADAPRATAGAAVAMLKAKGIGVTLLSGDNAATARRIAGPLGITDVIAQATPADKVAALRKLRDGGAIVAMVGDGVNDAPALAAADVGVAMGGGADVARAAAGITLMRQDPALVPAALEIAGATARLIRQNLYWAFGYNVVCLPVAAAGLLNPGVAGAAMALSSVSVVLNSLRLTRWRAPAVAERP